MSEAAHRDLLDRATAAIERIDDRLERQETAFARHGRDIDEFFRRIDERDAVATERHEALMREHARVLDRFARSEDRVVGALGEMQIEITGNTKRLDDMAGWIKANTDAVLAVLDEVRGTG